MADTDSFINEVTEEVRRDRLFALFRRWGWLAGLVVVLIVGAAGYTEYRRAQTTAAAQNFGDAVIAALDSETAADRIAGLEAIAPANAGAEMLLTLLVAAQETDAGDLEAAAVRLRTLAGRGDMPDRYRDLALLKAHMLVPQERAEAMVMLDRLAQPGAPYRALAIEQQAYLMIRDGETDDGIALLEELLVEASASPGLQDRVRQLIVALQSGATLSDAPLPELDLPGLVEFPVGAPTETDDSAVAAPEGAPDDRATTE